MVWAPIGNVIEFITFYSSFCHRHPPEGEGLPKKDFPEASMLLPHTTLLHIFSFSGHTEVGRDRKRKKSDA
eukprot:1138482-Pelagomonas_calceolata.AAC.1